MMLLGCILTMKTMTTIVFEVRIEEEDDSASDNEEEAIHEIPVTENIYAYMFSALRITFRQRIS